MDSSTILQTQWNSYPTMDHSKSIQEAIITTQGLVNKIQNACLELFIKIQDLVITTPLDPLLARFVINGTDIEKAFNIAECTPFIGIFIGSLRALAGKLQITAGGIIVSIGEIGLFVSSKPDGNADLIEKWRTVSKLGTELIIHGCLNILRGTGIALLGSCTMGLGNVILLFPNLSHNRNFDPIFAYGTLAYPVRNISINAVKNDTRETQKT